MRHSLLLFLCCWFGLPWLPAQSLRILETQVLTDTVAIRYQLLDSTAGRSYRVSLAAIRDQDTVPLMRVQGAVGDTIRAGQHELRWPAYQEWDRYRGRVRFLVQATPNFAYQAPVDSAVVRRAKGIEFAWYGQNSSVDSLRLDLYRYEEFVQTIARVKGRADYAWRVPPKMPLGEGYRLKLYNLDQRTQYGYGPYFTIDNRYPLWMKIVPPAVATVGVITYLILSILPDPPGPPADAR